MSSTVLPNLLTQLLKPGNSRSTHRDVLSNVQGVFPSEYFSAIVFGLAGQAFLSARTISEAVSVVQILPPLLLRLTQHADQVTVFM